MLRYILPLVFLCVVWANERKILSITDGDVNCGPVACPLDETHMCFYTSRADTDVNNSTVITTCGTCLSINGSIVKYNCNSEPTVLTNYTATVSINLLNSIVDQDRFRNGVIGLMLSEMGNVSPSVNSSVQVNTSPVTSPPSTAYVAQQQPIIVVQPPAQQIYINQPPTSYRDSNYESRRAERQVPNNLCNPPNCPTYVQRQSNGPNILPPLLNKMYNIIGEMGRLLEDMDSTVQDAGAGVHSEYFDEGSKYAHEKNPFPVWTPPGYN